MTWKYAVVKFFDLGEIEQHRLQVHEVYFADDNTPIFRTEEPICMGTGVTLELAFESLVRDAGRITQALSGPMYDDSAISGDLPE